jgi:hypothetical protein
MYNESKVVGMNLIGDASGQEGTDDEVGLGERRGLDHGRIGDGILNSDRVRLTQGQEELLRERVVRCAKKEDLHGCCRIRGRRLAGRATNCPRPLAGHWRQLAMM